MRFFLPLLTLVSAAQALYFYVNGATSKCFFEELPKGWKPSEATSKLNANEVATLQKQAYGQAERFEVLRADDVEALSKVQSGPGERVLEMCKQ